MKKYKKTDTTSYTLGTTVTIELLKCKPKQVTCVYIHSKQENNEALQLVETICTQFGIEIKYQDKVINNLSDKDNCMMIGVFNKYPSKIKPNENHIVLDNPSNFGNVGTIIRTAIGFNINNLAIIMPGVDIFNPKLIRATMGALFHMNIEYFESFNQYQQKTHNHMYPLMLQTNHILGKLTIQKPFSLIFGNEATGLDDSYLKIGQPLRIHHSSKIDSLNLDNAVSITLYEFTKGE